MDAQIAAKDDSFVGTIGAVDKEIAHRLASLFFKRRRHDWVEQCFEGKVVGGLNDRTYGDCSSNRQHLKR